METISELVQYYYEGGDLEEIAGIAAQGLDIETAARYYSNELDAEEFIAALQS